MNINYLFIIILSEISIVKNKLRNNNSTSQPKRIFSYLEKNSHKSWPNNNFCNNALLFIIYVLFLY